MQIIILGNSSATPTVSRNQSAQVLNLSGINYLLDCGEGAQAQMLRLKINQNKIRKVFISHLHPDHFTGLIGFITTQNLRHRSQPLDIYGPSGLQKIIETQLYHSDAYLHFDLNFHALDHLEEGSQFFEDHQLKGRVVHLTHRIPCFGFVFQQKSEKRKIKKEAVKQYPPPVEAFGYLEKGLDYRDKEGNRYQGEFYTIANRPAKSYAYITDTRYKETLVPLLHSVSTLYHEATFGEHFQEKAHKTYHSTAKEAATIALKIKAKKLLIGHFSARYKDLDDLLKEAREVFPETYLAVQGEKFQVEKPD